MFILNIRLPYKLGALINVLHIVPVVIGAAASCTSICVRRWRRRKRKLLVLSMLGMMPTSCSCVSLKCLNKTLFLFSGILLISCETEDSDKNKLHLRLCHEIQHNRTATFLLFKILAFNLNHVSKMCSNLPEFAMFYSSCFHPAHNKQGHNL